MKISKPIMIYIPALFRNELDKYLAENPPEFKAKQIFFYYLVNYIARKHAVKKKQEFITINFKYLSHLLAYNISSYADILENGEFIIQGKENQKGRTLKGYKLNEKYLIGLEKIEILPDTKLFDKLVKRQRTKKSHFSRLPPYLKQMKDKVMEIELDYDETEKWIMDNDVEKGYHSLVALSRLADPRTRNFHRNTTNNRLDTNFTNLNSELRQFIKGDLESIDLKNSQPFFLGQLVQHLIKNIQDSIINPPYVGKFSFSNLPETFGMRAISRVSKISQNDKKGYLANLSLFNDAALNGTLYVEFANLFEDKMTIGEAKDTMFKVLFSSNETNKYGRRFVPYKKGKDAFASVFPAVARVVEILKTKVHAKLAIYLQKMESYIFIDCIAKKLVENAIVPLTIHDSVIVESWQVEKTLEIMKEVFHENFNVVPSFHIKPLKNNRNEHH